MELNKKNVKTIIFIIVVAIVVYTILQNIPQSIALINWLLSMFKPMLYGLFIAIILVVPMRLFETKVFAKLKVKESAKPALSLVATLISALLVVGIAMFMIVPQFVTSIKSLLANIPTTVLNLQLWVSDILTKNPEIQEYLVSQDLNIMEYVTGAFRTLSEVGTKTVTSIVSYTSTFVSGVFNFVIGLIFASYALLQKERLTIHFKSLTYAYLHENTADRIIYVVRLANATFSNFVAGQSLEALILGSMCFVVIMILGLPHLALMISVFVAICSFVPIFGAFVSLFLGAFFIVLESPLKALLFIFLYWVIQQIDGNFVYLHVVGNRVGLPAIWVLFSVTIGGNLLGVLGMIIFIPITSVIYTILKSTVFFKVKDRGISATKIVPPAYLIEKNITDATPIEKVISPPPELTSPFIVDNSKPKPEKEKDKSVEETPIKPKNPIQTFVEKNMNRRRNNNK